MAVHGPVTPTSAGSSPDGAEGGPLRTRLRTDSFFGMPESPWPENDYGHISQTHFSSESQIDSAIAPASTTVSSAAVPPISTTMAATAPVVSTTMAVTAPPLSRTQTRAVTVPAGSECAQALRAQCGSNSGTPVSIVMTVAAAPVLRAPAKALTAPPGVFMTPVAASTCVSRPADDTRTTVMLRDLPEGLTRSSLMRLLDSRGLCGKYNFLYMPFDFDSNQNLRHAFVNMVTPADVNDLWVQFDGFSDWPVPSSNRCGLAWNNKQQGLLDLVERYRNSPVMHRSVLDECKPVLLNNGTPVPFPHPTQPLKPPKFRRKKCR